MTGDHVSPVLDALADALAGIDGIDIERNAPAGPLCTYRVGGPIGLLLRITTEAALHTAVSAIAEHKVSTLPIGKGSNLLVADAGFAGVGLLLDGELTDTTITGTILVAGAAASLPIVARASVTAGLSGFEWAVGVPGTIGGAVRMNAGGHGSDMDASLVAIELADLRSGTISTVPAHDLDLSYRHSRLQPWELVVSATLQLDPGNADVGAATLKEIVRWRREHQPGGANAGSVFTNPPDDSAGRLIDAAGMKGHRVGSAEVSPKHANFIQADPDGSADDVLALMIEIVDRIDETHGVRLHAETRLIGFPEADVERVQATDSHGDER